MISLKSLLKPLPAAVSLDRIAEQDAADLAEWLRSVPCQFPVADNAVLAYEIGLDEFGLPDFSVHLFTYVARGGNVYGAEIKL